MPLISVLILSYNHSEYVLDAIQSVECNASPDYSIEIIIIDDGSTDATVDLINEHKQKCKIEIKLVVDSHKGIHEIARNLNRLISMSRGDYLCFLASDDKYLDNRFNKQLDAMEKDPSLVLYYSNGVNVINGKIRGTVLPVREKNVLKSGDASKVYDFITSNIPSLFIQGCMLRASFAKSFDVFDDDLIADDWVFNINVFREISERKLKYLFTDFVIFQRNIHGSNTSRDPVAHFSRIKQVCERYVINDKDLIDEALFYGVYLSLLRLKFGSLVELFRIRLVSDFDLLNFIKISVVLVAKKVFLKN